MNSIAEPKRVVPIEISRAVTIWYRGSNILRFLHVFLGMIAIVLTITVASKIVDASNPLYSWISWCAAIATGLLTSFNLGTKSNNMRNAWRILNEPKIRYENQDDMTIEKLVDAYKDGEKLIGDVVVNL